MKKIFAGATVCSALLLAFTSVQAEPIHLTASDDSNLSALCVAAASSERPLTETVHAYGFNLLEMDELLCNDMPIKRFVARYREKVATAPKPLVFRKNDNSELTELCYQALSSSEQYQLLLHKHARNDASLPAELTCNGMPVTNFVSRYRKSAAGNALSLQ